MGLGAKSGSVKKKGCVQFVFCARIDALTRNQAFMHCSFTLLATSEIFDLCFNMLEAPL